MTEGFRDVLQIAPPGPPEAVRLVRAAPAAARAARANVRDPRADAPHRRGPRAARRGQAIEAIRAAPAAGVDGDRRVPAPRVRQPGPRAPSRRADRGALPGRRGLALVRRHPRVPRVRARQHDRRERLRDADRPAVRRPTGRPNRRDGRAGRAPHHAEQRRPDDGPRGRRAERPDDARRARPPAFSARSRWPRRPASRTSCRSTWAARRSTSASPTTGSLRFTKESEIGSLPIKVPMIDIHTLGAGGGSVAWIDAGGALRVGPRSAGAQPGPACYGRGGDEATVTDANVVLGRIDPANFLGGEMALDAEAARRAVEERIAEPLGLGVEEAAEGIIRVINATMVRGMRAVSVEKGYDPRDFAIVAFGGGGPLHAADLARELGVPNVLVPVMPGVTSALGLLVADLRYDVSATVRGSLAVARPRSADARVRGPGAAGARADGAGWRGAWRGAARPDGRRAVRAADRGSWRWPCPRDARRGCAGAGSLRIPCAPPQQYGYAMESRGADPRERAR